MPALLDVVEVKRSLLGGEKRFTCRLVDGGPQSGRAVLLWISPESRAVQNIDLPAGTVTLAYFWNDRPYNVYHWLHPRSTETIACYFNIADQTRISDGLIDWRDLVVDVLCTQTGAISVLDRDELPADLDSTLRGVIDAATADVVRRAHTLVAEAEQSSRALWPRIFAAGRISSGPNDGGSHG